VLLCIALDRQKLQTLTDTAVERRLDLKNWN